MLEATARPVIPVIDFGTLALKYVECMALVGDDVCLNRLSFLQCLTNYSGPPQRHDWDSYERPTLPETPGRKEHIRTCQPEVGALSFGPLAVMTDPSWALLLPDAW